jgi:hypothetical protein
LHTERDNWSRGYLRILLDDHIVADYAVSKLAAVLNLNIIPDVAVGNLHILTDYTFLPDGRVLNARIGADLAVHSNLAIVRNRGVQGDSDIRIEVPVEAVEHIIAFGAQQLRINH